jgi:hypothetical protein
MVRRTILLPLLALLTSLPASLLGQASGRLSGTILDPSGSQVPAASIQILIHGTESVAAKTSTNQAGGFAFVALLPQTYDVVIEAKGFQKTILRQIKVDANRENSLPPTKLELAQVSEVVEISETLQGIQTTNAEVTSILSNEGFRSLPQLNRNPQALLLTLPGVTNNGRQVTTINGLRPSYVNISVDGINIQDNFIRQNTVDFSPNMLLSDQVAEVTVSTSNSNANVGAGAAQVNYVTPSGGNPLHGAVYWFNRNNKLASNSWFNNQSGVRLPFLNQNQTGFRVSGPILKNKIFYYGNYEIFRTRQQASYNRAILTDDARRGIFTYRDTSGEIRKVNVLQLSGNTIDPFIQSQIGQLPPASAVNNYQRGDSTEALVRNTAGYRFLRRDNRTRDNVTGKFDYILSSSNTITGTFLWNRDLDDRPDVNNAENYSVAPTVLLESETRLLSAGWRSSPSPTMTNELRGGFNISRPVFSNSTEFGAFVVNNASLYYDQPMTTFQPQGRNVDTWNLSDIAGKFLGKHAIQFGFQMMLQRVNPFSRFNATPVYSVGVGAGQQGLRQADLPGISANDFSQANNFLATMAGLVNSYIQTFYAQDRTSGFVPGSFENRNMAMDNYSFFFTDTWKVLPRLSFTAGLRYEYWTVMDERDALALQPKLVDNNPINSLFFNNTLDFAGKAVGRPWYNADRNNLAPNVGLAWDVRGNGRTAVRAGFSMNYVNDSHMTAVRNTAISTNSGLSQDSQRTGLSGRLSSNRPSVVVPVFKVPRTFEDNYLLNSQQGIAIVDPGLVMPYVQQWNLSVQHSFFGGVLEARYVGNKVTKALRAFDYNQVLVRENGFVEDFQRARSNGFAAQAAGLPFSPVYNPNVPGSQQLTIFPQLSSGGLLTNSTVVGYIQRGEVGELGNFYAINNLRNGFPFYRQTLGLGMNMMTNYSNQSYNAVQLDYTRRMSRGLQAQVNYTYGKVMSDAAGTEQAQFEAFLDSQNAGLERARTPFDVTHAIKANFVYELPFGAGKKFDLGRAMNYLAGGWSVSGLMTEQSGSPFSIQSLRGTLNRGARSTGQNGNTATANVDKAALNGIVSFRMTGTGPYYVAASAINPADNRGVAADGRAPFNGQVFFNPAPGTLGALQRRYFSGPWWFNFDFGVLKNTRVSERFAVELRMESTNFINHPTFYIGDQDINSVNFGRITSTNTTARRIQFGLYLRF